MTHADDHPDKLRDDLRKWVGQNKDLGPDWFLDEGPVAAAEVPPASTVQPAAEAKPSAEPTAEIVAEPAPAPAPAPKPTSQPPAEGPAPAPPISNPEFKKECDDFTEATLGLLAQQPLRQVAADPLLEKHGGDPRHALKDLRDEVLPCRLCKLAETRTQVVFGAGSAHAKVMFIGEAPGRDEDLQGQPFVGASGQLLTKIIEAIGFDRRHIFIGNILKCRPPGNRDPLPDEVMACENFLKRQLAIIQPSIICCLGRVAAQTLLGTDDSLGKLRGSVHFYEGIPVMATYHPAALLRNPAWKRDTWNDVRRLRALYDALQQRRS